MDISYVEKRTIFETVAGSRAYGTYNEDSDYDKAGVMIPGKEYFYGFDKFEQFQGYPDEDKTIYDIRKALTLIHENNPNMLDLLYAPDKCIIKTTPYWNKILEHKDLFLSKRCRYTFSGYAIAQLQRIKMHRKYLLNPPTHKPSREDFGLPKESIFPSMQLKALMYSVIEMIVDEERPNFLDELDNIYSGYVIPLLARFVIPEQRVLAMERFQVAAKSQANTLLSLGTHYVKEEYYEMAKKEVEFYDAQKEWERYEQWKKTRNPKRVDLECKYGFDCYSNDTEFLTDSGWKLYEEVKSTDMLATIITPIKEKYRINGVKKRSHDVELSIEYQKYIDKFSGIYTGDMYNFKGNHIDFNVTPNHRVLYKQIEKNTGKESELYLEEASTLPNCFKILNAINPKTKNYSNSSIIPKEISDLIKIEPLLRIIGWFLSEGSVCFSKKGTPKSISLSQIKGGRLHNSYSKYNNKYKNIINSSLYVYERCPNNYHKNKFYEVRYCIRNKNFVKFVHDNCGHYKNKRIPRWAFGLSKRLMEILLDSMINEGGAIRNTSLKSIIYYTSVKKLADDVQEMAVLCGWETSLHGPYNTRGCDMYHVHINKNPDKFSILTKYGNITKVYVKNQKIVCFTVPNHTLITRRKGHIAFQGNSKHGAHLVRLMRMGKEALEQGTLNVDRTNIDAEELKAIRNNGIMTYEQLEEYSKKMDSELGELYKTSKLQKIPQRTKINELCIEIVESYLKSSL